MPVPIFIGRVVDGKPILQQLERYRLWLRTLEGKDVELVIRKKRVQRSIKQNSFLHGVIIPLMAEHLGYDNDELKQVLKWRYLRMEDSNGIETTLSTADLTVEQFSAFVENVKQLAAELGVLIPDPSSIEP